MLLVNSFVDYSSLTNSIHTIFESKICPKKSIGWFNFRLKSKAVKLILIFLNLISKGWLVNNCISLKKKYLRVKDILKGYFELVVQCSTVVGTRLYYLYTKINAKQ